MEEQKKSRTRKWIFIGLGTIAAGTISYLGWHYLSPKSNSAETPQAEPETPSIPNKPGPQANEESMSDNFPLKMGSKGELVKQFQQALIRKYGKNILPKFGADGDFGSEVLAALKKVGMSETIDVTAFNVLVKSGTNPAEVAKKFYELIGKMDFNTILSTLKVLRNPQDYKAVADEFLRYRIKGVRQTLVTALMDTFPDERLRGMLRMAFAGIGLKYDGNKWTLSGFAPAKTLITITSAKVWKSPREATTVAANTVLGNEIARRGSYSVFKSDEQHFLVESKQVKYYN